MRGRPESIPQAACQRVYTCHGCARVLHFYTLVVLIQHGVFTLECVRRIVPSRTLNGAHRAGAAREIRDGVAHRARRSARNELATHICSHGMLIMWQGGAFQQVAELIYRGQVQIPQQQQASVCLQSEAPSTPTTRFPYRMHPRVTKRSMSCVCRSWDNLSLGTDFAPPHIMMCGRSGLAVGTDIARTTELAVANQIP